MRLANRDPYPRTGSLYWLLFEGGAAGFSDTPRLLTLPHPDVDARDQPSDANSSADDMVGRSHWLIYHGTCEDP